MQIEVRKTSDHVCEKCGAHDLIAVQDLPLTADLSRLLEVEALRREVRLAQAFRNTQKQIEIEHAAELSESEESYRELLVQLDNVLSEAKVDVPRYRLFRSHREKIFAKRINDIAAELIDRTNLGISSLGEKDRS